MRKNRIVVAIIMIMAVLIAGTFTVNAEPCHNAHKLRHDFHKHLMNPVNGEIYRQMMGISSTITGQNVIDELPDGASATVISDGYITEVFYDMGVFGEGDAQQLLQYANNYAALQVALHSDRLIGFASVNPLKPYALDEVKRCYEQLKLPGLKLYFPHSGVDLNNPEHVQKLMPIFEYCAGNEIPILIHHAGYDPNYGYNDARQLMELAANFPGIRIQIAHMGGSGIVRTIYFDYLQGLIDAMAQYPDVNVFLDLSAIIIDGEDDPQYPIYGETTPEECQQLVDYIREIGLDKVLFGSDSPVYTTQGYLNTIINKLPFTHHELNKILKQRPEKSIFEGVYRGNKIMHPTLEGLEQLGITPDSF